MLKENEELFRRLNSFHIEGPGAKELIEQGYLTNTYFGTQKAEDFRHRFINKNKEVLLQAIKRLGSTENRSAVMDDAGIAEFATFRELARCLVQEGRLIEKEDGIYYPSV